MTIDELRAFCLSLPGTHEKETWGDAEHAGDVTFRVKDKIYVMTGPDGGRREHPDRRSTSRRSSSTRSRRVPVAAYVGRFGWVSRATSRTLDASCCAAIIEGAWRRTAPKAVVARVRASAAR